MNLRIFGCMSVCVFVGTAGAQVHFSREFAPTDAYVKSVERPYRDAVCLNGSWQFRPESIATWDSTPLKVPSPWNVNSFANEAGGGDFVTYPSYPRAWDTVRSGMLRRGLPYKKEWAGKRLILHFNAVAGHTTVYVNGVQVGTNVDPFLPFDIDITDRLVQDGKNELSLGITDANLFNQPGPFGRRTYVGGSFWGQHIRGIWQDVYLLVKPAIYVETTAVNPEVAKDRLDIEATIRNESSAARTIQVKAIVQPWINKADSFPEPAWALGDIALSTPTRTLILAPHSVQKVVLRTEVNGRLALWSSEHPDLYGLTVQVDAGASQPLDRSYTRFGWRQFRIEGKHLYLNGHPLVLKGDSWHFMGIPQMTRRYAWAWFTMLKAAHANAVRLHAEPYPSFYLDMADEMGLFVLDETGLWASDGGPKIDADAYWENSEDHLRRFITRDINHPSVFGWSVCNENIPVAVNVFHAPDSLVRRQLTEINRWVSIAKAQDPSRNWISGDGETGQPTELPTLIGHYGDEAAFKEWSSQTVLWGIGESGMAYYGTPRQAAVYGGDAAYLSPFGRMEGVAAEATHILNLQKKYQASYLSVFNLVWYGLQPLELGLADTTRAPKPGDGVYFPPFQEGKPGVQPERLGPYTSTLNPGYDPSLPLYRTWPLFQAIQAAFGDTAQQPETAPPPRRITMPLPSFATARLLSADTLHAMHNLLTELGMGLDSTSRLVILDGSYPPVDSLSLIIAQRAGTLLVWGPVPGTEQRINRYLPSPLGVTMRKATSFVIKAVDPILEGLDDADFYYSETAVQPVSRYGLIAPSSATLLEDCNTDWKAWNNRPEYMKTIAVLRSEREAKPPGAALVKYPGQIYCLAPDPLALCKASEPTVRRLFENLGLRFTGSGERNPPAFDTTGALRNALVANKLVRSFDGVFTYQRVDTLSFWLYSPRSLVNLLVEPDLPTLNLHVHTEGEVNIYVGDKRLDGTILPLEKGWNLVRVIPATRSRSLSATLDCNHPVFLRELLSNVYHP